MEKVHGARNGILHKFLKQKTDLSPSKTEATTTNYCLDEHIMRMCK